MKALGQFVLLICSLGFLILAGMEHSMGSIQEATYHAVLACCSWVMLQGIEKS